MACLCGAVIRDTVYPCATEGLLLRQQDQERCQEAVGRDIVAFFAAVRDGHRDEWIERIFGAGSELRYDNDDEVVWRINHLHLDDAWLSIAECETCGRLWVQKQSGQNAYLSYAPDQSGYAAVLRRAR